jgi:hypothetical protein
MPGACPKGKKIKLLSKNNHLKRNFENIGPKSISKVIYNQIEIA